MSNSTCIECIQAACIGAVSIILLSKIYIKYLLSERTKWHKIHYDWRSIRRQITIYKGI